MMVASWLAILVLVLVALVILGGIFGLISLVSNPKTRPVVLGLMAIPLVVFLVGGIAMFVLWAPYARPRVVHGVMERPPGSLQVSERPMTARRQATAHNHDTGNHRLATLSEEVPRFEVGDEVVDTEIIEHPSQIATVLRVLSKAVLTAIAEDEQEQPAGTHVVAAASPEQVPEELLVQEAQPALEPPPASELPAADDAESLAPATPGRPEWVVDAELGREGPEHQVSLVVGPFTSPKECKAELQSAANEAVDHYVSELVGPQARGRVHLPFAYLNQHVIKDQYEQWEDYSVGRMVKLHALLEFDGAVNEKIENEWERVVVTRRLWIVAEAAAAVLLFLFVLYTYLRIDLATNGAYRGRLRLAVGAALLLMFVVMLKTFPLVIA